ncbi:MAG TPA: hypothetical protein VGD81_13365 [Opitutaceae bacterium]
MSASEHQPTAARIDWLAGADEAGRWREWWTPQDASDSPARAHEAWGRLEAALAAPLSLTPADWAGLIRTASEELHEALETDFPGDDTAQAAAGLFLAGLNRELASRRVPVRCGLVFPGARFDPDSMESVGALSGNRFLVHRVCSWLVRDLSGPKPRIAARARVVTA